MRPRVVPFPRISPILARSNVRALIVHWFLSKEKRDRGKKEKRKKKKKEREKKDEDLCSLDNCSLVRNSLKNRRAVGVMYDAKKLLFKATMWREREGRQKERKKKKEQWECKRSCSIDFVRTSKFYEVYVSILPEPSQMQTLMPKFTPINPSFRSTHLGSVYLLGRNSVVADISPR